MNVVAPSIDVSDSSAILDKGDINSGEADNGTREQFEGMPSGWYAPGAVYLDEVLVPGPVEQQFIDDDPDSADEMLEFDEFMKKADDLPNSDSKSTEPESQDLA